MSVWDKYTKEQQKEYVQFLSMYGALSNLFRQKHTNLIPHLDSKFQETIYAKIFASENVDIGNTPHDVLSVFGDERIGIGIKTWMNSRPSYQKVMQIKAYQNDLNEYHANNDMEGLALSVSKIKNERLESDYKRLGLKEGNNIYHYVTRDAGQFVINECSYPLVDLQNIRIIDPKPTSLSWTDGLKDYRYTFADSQIWQRFDSEKKDTLVLNSFNVDILKNPFDFLLQAYLELLEGKGEKAELDIVEVFLPLYSYSLGKVGLKSGLNAWNAAPKNKNSNTPRPLNEVYIPVPIDFHRKCPRFFTRDEDMLDLWERREGIPRGENKPEVRFYLQLPNGEKIPSLLTGDFMKNLQSGSMIERDMDGKLIGQSALGQWLLVDVLGLKDRVVVTREWLRKKGTDSVRLWRKKDDFETIHIDFAPIGSFEAFMADEPLPEDDSHDFM